MSYRYYLGPWVWQTGPFPSWVPPAGAVGSVDLATPAQCAAAANPAARGVGLFATAGVLDSPYTPLGAGDLREIPARPADRAAWLALAGYRPQGKTLLDCLWDHLTNGGDPDGSAGVRPLLPGTDSWLDLWLGGHGRVRGEAFSWGRPGSRGTDHTPKVRAALRAEFRAHFLRDQTHARRVLQFWTERYPGADWHDLVPPDLLPSVPGPLPHRTTIADTFNRADSTGLGTASGGFTYAAVGGTAFNVVSNRAVSQDDACRTRAETDLSSADNYSQVLAVAGSTVWAPLCRFSPSAATCYQFNYRSDDVNKLYKIVAGTATLLGSSGNSATTNHTPKVDASGSSITAYVDGAVEVATVTDTAVTGNVRCGFGATAGNTIDNFEAGDLAAGGGGVLYTQLERDTRGLLRGVYGGGT